MTNHTVEFDDIGGYDCMSAAYLIKDWKGRTLAKIDLNDWLYAYHGNLKPTYEESHAPDLAAHGAAVIMALALDASNDRGGYDAPPQ